MSDEASTHVRAPSGEWPSGLDLEVGPADRRRSTELLDQAFHALIEVLRPSLFVEAGAHDAQASLQVAATLPACRVVAYEANPHVHSRFTAQNDYGHSGVEYVHAALTDAPGPAVLQLITDSASASPQPDAGYHSLLQRTGDDWLGEVEYEPVRITGTSLDEAFTDFDGPVALWIDVEGMAGAVLAGGRTLLSRCVLAKVEVEEFPFWHGQWLSQAVVAEMAARGLTPVARDLQHDEQFNLVFVRPAAIERDDVRAVLRTLVSVGLPPDVLSPVLRGDLTGLRGSLR